MCGRGYGRDYEGPVVDAAGGGDGRRQFGERSGDEEVEDAGHDTKT